MLPEDEMCNTILDLTLGLDGTWPRIPANGLVRLKRCFVAESRGEISHSQTFPVVHASTARGIWKRELTTELKVPGERPFNNRDISVSWFIHVPTSRAHTTKGANTTRRNYLSLDFVLRPKWTRIRIEWIPTQRAAMPKVRGCVYYQDRTIPFTVGECQRF